MVSDVSAAWSSALSAKTSKTTSKSSASTICSIPINYAKALETVGIETLEGTLAAKVRAIQLFDVNGRRLSKAQKGITIVKKVMSDGSIQTEKVIVK